MEAHRGDCGTLGRSQTEARQRRAVTPHRQDDRLQGKEITGPPTFACKTPHYKESDSTADTIFQGAIGEMQLKNKSVDPNKLAASLGFAGSGIKTLETGCEIDFHFVDAATAETGLNDNVYTLKKQ